MFDSVGTKACDGIIEEWVVCIFRGIPETVSPWGQQRYKIMADTAWCVWAGRSIINHVGLGAFCLRSGEQAEIKRVGG